ncbi:hypothetical protein ALC56_04604 [Trachymyrmex septentrionalis]|uniref:Uncharacterized protein n=1 Tax=Trachymyrmex septentrionalis TaxID=34720 RepID=A0A195FKY8_9HYME|nr:hypothetical protein ALC56_04604 [Trachymyrmex septentrionalis]
MFRVYAGRPILVALATRLRLPLFHGSPAKAERRRRGVQHCKAARNLGVGAREQPAARAKGPRATGCDVLVRLNIDTQRATCDDEAAAAAAAAASDACPLARFLHSLDSSQGYNCHRQLRTVAAKRFEWFPKRKDSALGGARNSLSRSMPEQAAGRGGEGKKKQEKKKKKKRRRVGTRREKNTGAGGGPSLRTAGNSAQPPPTGTSDESIDLGVGLKTPLSPAPLASARSLVAAPPPPCSSSALPSKGSLPAVLYTRHSGLRRACLEFSRQKSPLIGQHPRNFQVCNLEDWRKRDVFSTTAGMKDGKRIYKASRIVLTMMTMSLYYNSDASLSPDIIGLVSSLPVPFCIEYWALLPLSSLSEYYHPIPTTVTPLTSMWRDGFASADGSVPSNPTVGTWSKGGKGGSRNARKRELISLSAGCCARCASHIDGDVAPPRSARDETPGGNASWVQGR